MLFTNYPYNSNTSIDKFITLPYPFISTDCPKDKQDDSKREAGQAGQLRKESGTDRIQLTEIPANHFNI
jgi:hypothetical protein